MSNWDFDERFSGSVNPERENRKPPEIKPGDVVSKPYAEEEIDE